MALWRWNVESTVADIGFSPKTKPAHCLTVQRWLIYATASQLAILPFVRPEHHRCPDEPPGL